MVTKYPSLENKSYLITGVTSGIGKEICTSLLKQGAKVIGLGRDSSKIKTILNNNLFTFKSFDLTSISKIESLFESIFLSTNKLDGLVHCAGKEETIPLNIYKPEKIKSIFEINVFSGIELLRVFSKKKYSNENSSIVFFSSVMGELGQSGKIGYCASKAAILGVVNSSSLELAKRKIRVNAISPGIVKTPMTQKLFNNLNENNIKEIEKMHPLGFGNVNDIYPTVLFLLSNQSNWITGQNIKIDGGYSTQ